MQVRREAFEPAHRFGVLVRTHRHIMSPVPNVNPGGFGMHHLQPRIRRLQLPRQLFPLLSIHLVGRHLCTPLSGKWTRFGPAAIGLRVSPTGSKLLSFPTSVATMPVIANTGATLLIGHESARQRFGLSCRSSSCTKISNAQPIAKFLAPVTPELASDAVN